MAAVYASKRLNCPAAEFGIPGMVVVAGKFTTAGAASPTVFSSGPFVVTYPSVTGKIVITGLENASEILSVTHGLEDSTGSSKSVKTLSTSVGTTSTGWVVNLETQSTAGTAANLTGPVIHFTIFYRKGALTK